MIATLNPAAENFLAACPVPPAPLSAVQVLIPEPRNPHHADPDSPVGRAAARSAVDPDWNNPLRRLEGRLGRPLLDLRQCTDSELVELTYRLLTERGRRDDRWRAL